MAKLNAHDLSLSALKRVHSYLQNRNQRTKICVTYSLWEAIISGVPQGWILGPFLFIIFLCDLLVSLANNHFTSHADDATRYGIGNNPEEVVSELKDLTQKLFTRFAQNKMKANLSKFHVLFNATEAFNLEILNSVRGVNFGNRLRFKNHII